MRVTILAVGHKMPAWVRDGFREYARRMPPEVQVELVELKTDDKLVESVPKGGTLIALDEHGKQVTTQGLAVMMSEWMRDGSHPVFAIGGADGHTDALRDKAQKIISLSALTMPHMLVRVLLAEQLYRAWTILARHPYHRE